MHTKSTNLPVALIRGRSMWRITPHWLICQTLKKNNGGIPSIHE